VAPSEKKQASAELHGKKMERKKKMGKKSSKALLRSALFIQRKQFPI